MTRKELWTLIGLFIRGAWRSRTMWAAGLIAALGALEARSFAISQVLGQHATAWVLFVVAMLMAVLRGITVSSVIGKIPGTAAPTITVQGS